VPGIPAPLVALAKEIQNVVKLVQKIIDSIPNVVIKLIIKVGPAVVVNQTFAAPANGKLIGTG